MGRAQTGAEPRPGRIASWAGISTNPRWRRSIAPPPSAYPSRSALSSWRRHWKRPRRRPDPHPQPRRERESRSAGEGTLRQTWARPHLRPAGAGAARGASNFGEPGSKARRRLAGNRAASGGLEQPKAREVQKKAAAPACPPRAAVAASPQRLAVEHIRWGAGPGQAGLIGGTERGRSRIAGDVRSARPPVHPYGRRGEGAAGISKAARRAEPPAQPRAIR